MKKTLSVVLLLVLLWQAGTAQTAVKNPQQQTAATQMTNRIPPHLIQSLQFRYREPFVAGLLTSMFWGLGHFYTKEYTRGSLLMFSDLIYKGLLVGLLLKLKNRYTDSNGDDTVSWKELSGSDKGLVLGYIISWLGISIWAAYDAAESAHRFNRKFDLQKNLDLKLVPDGQGAGLQLGWKQRF